MRREILFSRFLNCGLTDFFASLGFRIVPQVSRDLRSTNQCWVLECFSVQSQAGQKIIYAQVCAAIHCDILLVWMWHFTRLTMIYYFQPCEWNLCKYGYWNHENTAAPKRRRRARCGLISVLNINDTGSSFSMSRTSGVALIHIAWRRRRHLMLDTNPLIFRKPRAWNMDERIFCCIICATWQCIHLGRGASVLTD